MGGLAAFGVQWAIRFRRVISPIGVEGVVFHRVLMGACHDGCLSLDLGPQGVFSHGEFGGVWGSMGVSHVVPQGAGAFVGVQFWLGYL